MLLFSSSNLRLLTDVNVSALTEIPGRLDNPSNIYH